MNMIRFQLSLFVSALSLYFSSLSLFQLSLFISALSLCLKQSMAETELQRNAARDLRKYQIIAGRYAEAFNHSVL
jgi:hypothetical protein